MDYINNNLEELEGQKNELTKYRELDTDRRVIEYCINDLQQKKVSFIAHSLLLIYHGTQVRDEMERIETDKARHIEDYNQLRNRKTELDDELGRLKAALAKALKVSIFKRFIR